MSGARIARPDARERQLLRPTERGRAFAEVFACSGHELVEVKGPREPGVSGPKES